MSDRQVRQDAADLALGQAIRQLHHIGANYIVLSTVHDHSVLAYRMHDDPIGTEWMHSATGDTLAHAAHNIIAARCAAVARHDREAD